MTSLVRLDLIRRHWRAYLAVAAATLLMHVVFTQRFGLSTSTDFAVRYDPGARALLGAFGLGPENAASIGSYGWSRIGYIAYVALTYATWGIGNWPATIYAQLAVVWLVYPLIFHVLLHLTGRLRLSLAAIAVWLTFLDGYQWQTWALPDALYRLMFVAAFFVLLRLWETDRRRAFVAVLVGATVLLTLFRIETPLYALPGFWLAFAPALGRRPALGVAAVAVIAAVVWVERGFFGDLLTVYLKASGGILLNGQGYHIPGVTIVPEPANPTLANMAGFYAHVFGMRFWYSVTPFPALWSRAHQLYYAAYLLPAYVLLAFGLAAAVRARDAVFMTCFWIFTAAILLRIAVHVDPPLRYAYTPQVFHFLCAVLGWPAFAAAVRRRLGSHSRAVAPV